MYVRTYVRMCACVYIHIYIYIYTYTYPEERGGWQAQWANKQTNMADNIPHPSGGRKIAVSAFGEDDPAGLEAGLLRRLAQGAGRGAAAVLVPERGE